MIISCSICSDLLLHSEEACGTQCGHLFHYQCLLQWIERSKSCPQCRSKASEKSIIKIFFNIASNEASLEDPSVLHSKVDNLSFQLKLKETDLKNAREEISSFQDKTSLWKAELKEKDNKIKELKVAVQSAKQEADYCRKMIKESVSAKSEAQELRKQLEFLKSVEMVVRDSAEDVEEMLENYSNTAIKPMATFVSVLKRELLKSGEKKKITEKKLRDSELQLQIVSNKIKKLQEEISQKQKIISQLEEDVKHCEDENKSLRKKIKDLELAVISPNTSKPSERALRRLLAESPAPEALKRPKLTDPALDKTFTCTPKSTKIVSSNVLQTSPPASVNDASSPYLLVKSSSFGMSALKSINYEASLSNFKMRCSSTLTYDGLGGQTSDEIFPKPSFRIKTCKKTVSNRVKNNKPEGTNIAFFFKNA